VCQVLEKKPLVGYCWLSLEFGAEMTKIICPRCGSKRIAENRWGKHIFTEKLFNDVEKGRVRIKKGKKKDGSFDYWCHDCQKDFGRSSLRYPAETISNFSLTVGNAGSGQTTIEIYPVDRVIMAVIDQSARDVIIPNRPALWVNGKLWATFTKKLLKDNLLLEWAKKYDGTDDPSAVRWSLDVQFSLAKRMRWQGSNEWPPYWGAMVKRLTKLLKRSVSAVDTDKITRVWLEQCISHIASKNPSAGIAEGIDAADIVEIPEDEAV
jgi:DNA-directed RNA polymerase subunit RPC12/RpoP